MREMECVFHERIISRDLRSARSSEMPPCDFYLWGRLKNVVYKTNSRTMEELKSNIRDEINRISKGELQASYGKFYKELPKMVGQRRWTVPAPPSIKLVSCKIVTEICVVVSLSIP